MSEGARALLGLPTEKKIEGEAIT